MSEYYSDAPAGPLFAPAARRTDPPTSHAAAAKKEEFADTHRGHIYRALRAGPGGQTEIARRLACNPPHLPLLPHQVGKRLSELVRLGLIVEDGEAVSASGNAETRYRRVT